jgi:hypothetical protein
MENEFACSMIEMLGDRCLPSCTGAEIVVSVHGVLVIAWILSVACVSDYLFCFPKKKNLESIVNRLLTKLYMMARFSRSLDGYVNFSGGCKAGY